MAAQPIDRLHVSAFTLAEIRFGTERGDNPAKRLELHEWHGLTVVTRDRDDFERARVPVLNPWTEPPP